MIQTCTQTSFKSLLIFIIFIQFSGIIFSQRIVEIDLATRKSGSIEVTIVNLNFDSDQVLFQFPAVIPGMYEQNDFGRFVSNFRIIDSQGKSRKIGKKNKNTYVIKDAKRIKKISYTVNQTEHRFNRKPVFLAGGTFFNRDHSALLNFHSLVGYNQSQVNEALKIVVKHKFGLSGGGSLHKRFESEQIDTLDASSYHHLIDSPMLYYRREKSLNYDESLSINGHKIYIHIEPNSQSLTCEPVKRKLEPICSFIENNSFLSSFYNQEYHFIMCFAERHSHFVGALEHNTSSVYFFNDTIGIQDFFRHTLTHEFLHVVTPLNIRSQLIDSFDFNNPKCSQHLWLYEGVTEYLSLKLNLNAGLIDTLSFFKELRSKHVSQDKINAISMTELSRNVLTPKYNEHYDLVYSRGAIIAFYLDLTISKNTQGRESLVDLLIYLKNDVCNNGVFEEDALFSKIKFKYPYLHDIIDKHIIGIDMIQFNEVLQDFGVQLKQSEEEIHKTFMTYNIQRTIKPTSKPYVFIMQQELCEQFKKKQLKVLEINGEKVNNLNYRNYLMGSNSDTLSLRISGKKEPVLLIPQERVWKYNPTIISFEEDKKQQYLDFLKI